MLSKERFFPRDLSWLSFNYRVLLEAADEDLPLYERIKFLAIYSSNMGEFYRVRVAAIQGLIKYQKNTPNQISGLSPELLLEQIKAEVYRQQEVFGQIFHGQILPDLKNEGINLLLNPPEFEVHQEFIRNFFKGELQAFLHTEVLRKNKILHFLREGALYLCIKLRNRPRNYAKLDIDDLAKKSESKRIRYALIQIPTHYFPRFIELPQVDGGHYYMFLDDIIRFNLKQIFHGYDILASHSIKLNRNADLLIEDEFDGNLVDKIKSSLKRRKVGYPSRFLYDQAMPPSMLKYLRDTFDLKKRELVPGGKYHSYSDFFGFPNPYSPRLEKEPMPPMPKSEFKLYANMFAAIQLKNWLLHFPYHSYDPVLSFLNQAATDPAVTKIYATQYRVASNSQIVNALIRAAQNNKEVNVFVEIKARFDEASNLKSAEAMREAGVNIVYSMPGLKVHAKVAMVIRMENEQEKGYAFLSTGNFNEKTAAIYTDQGFFTSNELIINELGELFKHLTDWNYKPQPFERLLVAQFGMKEKFLDFIQHEIDQAKVGRPAGISIKLNNLEDPVMIEKLYEASQAGVKIRLIVRGICALRPGLPDLSENITIRRIVDQFLEHTRLFIFHHSGEEKMYLGSADWMKRNLNRRIEVAFPIMEKQLKKELKNIFEIQWKDNVKATQIDHDLQNQKFYNDEEPTRAQWEIYKRIKSGKLHE
ncbi:MAG: polyphosphate kinase 1 [Bacteroidia bacterium]|nr:polyphosphate kinase 1 [Bacteroidia bacterium]